MSQSKLKRQMKSRHLFMMSLGGLSAQDYSLDPGMQ